MSKTNYFQLNKLGEEEWDIGLICLNDLEERYSERKNSHTVVIMIVSGLRQSSVSNRVLDPQSAK